MLALESDRVDDVFAKTSARQEFGRSWTIVLASAIGFGCGGSGLPLYTNGVFAVPLAKAFGWGMSTLQTNIMLIAITNIAGMPVAGWLCDRFGSRRVALVSLSAYSLCLMLLSQQNGSLVRFYGLWLMVAISGAGTLPVVWSRVIVGWFDHARGLALGLTLLGTGLTGAVAPPLLSFLIQTFGWRLAYVGLGLAPLLIALPLTFLFFRDSANTPQAPVRLEGATPRQAVRSYRYWIIGVCLFVVTFAVSALIPNMIRLLVSHGYSLQNAAWAAGVIGLFVIIGRPACGWLMDRFWAPAVACGFFATLPVACLLLMAHGLPHAMVVAAAALIGLGAAAEFDVIPVLVSRYFGVRAFGTILGQIMLFFCVASAIAPVAFGLVFDWRGNYDIALLASAAITALAPLLVVFLGPYAEFGEG